jgi:hypothetical protein
MAHICIRTVLRFVSLPLRKGSCKRKERVFLNIEHTLYAIWECDESWCKFRQCADAALAGHVGVKMLQGFPLPYEPLAACAVRAPCIFGSVIE